MSENQLAVYENLSADDVLRQIQMVQQLMAKAMKDGTHYGAIPGTGQKKSLLKPGADKLCLMFRLSPTYDVRTTKHGDGHREVEVTCTLTQITTGRVFAQGLGSCSTMESKYRYRNDVIKGEDGHPMHVPKDYWATRDPGVLGGPELSVKKVDGKWMVVRKVETVDLADVYNTVLKMAKKRAFVDATISATSASDIFTQDLGEEEEQPRETGRQSQDITNQIVETVSVENTWVSDPKSEDKDQRSWYNAKSGDFRYWTRKAETGDQLLNCTGRTVKMTLIRGIKNPKNFQVVDIALPEPDDVQLEEQSI